MGAFNFMLTKNFSLWEFFKTSQGLLFESEQLANFGVILRNIIKHNEDNSVSLLPTAVNIIRLAGVLQSFRSAWNTVIRINSGVRSAELNMKVGGVPTSKHLTGAAADIYFNGVGCYNNPPKYGTPHVIESMFDDLKKAKVDGLLSEVIFHDNYVHVAL